MNILQSLVRQILEVSLAMSLVIAILLLLRPILGKRYRSNTFYWIWLLVALRLAVPLNFSIFPALVNFNVPDTVLVHSDVPEVDKAAPSVIEPVLPLDMTNDSHPEQAKALPTTDNALTIGQMVSIIWALGTGIFFAGNLIAYARFRRKVHRWSQTYVDSEGLALFNELKQETGVKYISAVLCYAVPSPLVFGFTRPTLLLSKDNYTHEELEAIFCHELIHVRRCDLWYKLLLLIARSLHWFNPIVHLMARRGEEDLEISCDEAVVKGKPASFQSRYGHAVLSVTEYDLNFPVSLTTHFKGKNTMKERLSAISGKTGQRKGTLIVFLAALTVTLAAAGCSLNSTTDNMSLSGNNPVTTQSNVRDVLSGDQQFLYAAEGGSAFASLHIADIPSLFDPNDAYMAIQDYAIIDLDSDGTDEAVIFVCGAAGDMGGYLVLHSINDHIYGYRTNYRTFENLKTDGTFSYSDDSGTKEGVAVIGFTQSGLVLKDVLSATGQAYMMNSFMIDGKKVTEEEYNTEKEKQTLKNNVEWCEFSMQDFPQGDVNTVPEMTEGLSSAGNDGQLYGQPKDFDAGGLPAAFAAAIKSYCYDGTLPGGR